MHPEIRKIVTYDEEILIEGFRKTKNPWRLFAVAAVIKNPWAGRFVENLKPEILPRLPCPPRMSRWTKS